MRCTSELIVKAPLNFFRPAVDARVAELVLEAMRSVARRAQGQIEPRDRTGFIDECRQAKSADSILRSRFAWKGNE